MTRQDWLQLELGQQRWWVDPAWRERLLGAHGLRLDEWQRQGLVEVVKQSMGRTVYRVGLADQAVFVKDYPVQDWRAKLRQCLRPAKALHEWHQADRLSQAVPTIKPIAAGVQTNGASMFVSEAIEGASSLHAYVEELKGNTQEKRLALRELGGLLARLHRQGFAHPDLHGDNLLVRRDLQGHREWLLIDPYTVVSPASSWRTKLSRLVRSTARSRLGGLQTSIALLGMAYWVDLSVTDRLRFWRAFRSEYGEYLALSRRQERALLQRIEQEIWKRTVAVWSKRADRCVQDNSDFGPLEHQHTRAWASKRLPQEWVRSMVADPEMPLRDANTTILKTSRHGLVARIRGPGGQAQLYKRFDRRPGSHWRQTPARRCFRMAYRLQLARLDTAAPLAVIESPQASYLLTEFLDDAVSLIDHVDRCRKAGDWRSMRGLTRHVARQVRRLHDFKLSHRDLKAVNLLVRPGPRIHFIDLRGVRQHHWLMRQRRRKDLARLALSATRTLGVTRTDLLRFLRCYLGNERWQWKAWWRTVSRYCHLKVIRNIHRERVVS